MRELGRTRDPRHEAEVAGALRSDDDDWVRVAAARALGSIGGEEAVEALLSVETGSSAVRKAAALALGVLGDRRAVPRLIGWLDDEAVDDHAAEALGRIGDPAAVPALAGLLERRRGVLRWTPREALRQVGTPEAVEALRRQPRRNPLLRWMDVRTARRAVAARRARASGALPARLHPWPRWDRVSSVKELALAALIGWVPFALLGAIPQLTAVPIAVAGFLLFMVLVTERRDRERTLDRARWDAQREPRARGTPAALPHTIRSVFVARPWRPLVAVVIALALEWASGASGVASATLAGAACVTALDRLLLARMVASWEREAGARLLIGPGRRFFLAERLEPSGRADD